MTTTPARRALSRLLMRCDPLRTSVPTLAAAIALFLLRHEDVFSVDGVLARRTRRPAKAAEARRDALRAAVRAHRPPASWR